MTTEPAAEYRADADASSPSPQDWGRALQVVLLDLAEQAERDGRGTIDSALLDADLALHIDRIEGGVRISGIWRPDPATA